MRNINNFMIVENIIHESLKKIFETLVITR